MISLESRVIENYKLLGDLSEDEKITQIQRNLKREKIKIRRKTLGAWIEKYRQKLEKKRKDLKLKNPGLPLKMTFDISFMKNSENGGNKL